VNEAAKSATKAAARKSQPSEPTTRHATPRSERADGMGMMSVWCVSVKTAPVKKHPVGYISLQFKKSYPYNPEQIFLG
jgi:hypothetical protein